MKQHPGIAKDVLAIDDPDPATKKIINLCRAELEHIAQFGYFPKNYPSPSGSLLWSIHEASGRLFRAETQAIEGINSIIRIMDKRSPNISLELLSSRLTIKKALGLHTGGKSSTIKFSAIRPVAEAILTDIMQHKITCLSVLADTNRWAPISEPPPPIAWVKKELGDSDMGNILDAMHDGGQRPGNGAGAILPATPAAAKKTSSGCGSMASSNLVEVNLWAKSYNKGYKWRTCGNKKGKAGKTTGPAVMKHRGQGIVGLGLVTFKVIQPTATAANVDGLPMPDFYIVVDRFAHSVCFSKLSIRRSEEQPGMQFLVWDTSWTSRNYTQSIESIQMMSSFYDECVLKKNTVEVKSAFLNSNSTLQLLDPAKYGYLPLDCVLESAVLLFTMDSNPMKGVTIVRKPNSKPKPQAPAAAEEPMEAALGDTADESESEDDQKLFLDDGEHGSDASSVDEDEGSSDGSLANNMPIIILKNERE